MTYEVLIRSGGHCLRLAVIPDTPLSLVAKLRVILADMANVDVVVLRDGVEMSQDAFETALASDRKNREVADAINDDSKLRSGYRQGWGRTGDYVRESDGRIVSVDKPENPEDRYD
jgi:hypothetical protein